MIYYNQTYHKDGNLYICLTDQADYAATLLDDFRQVLSEISRRDAGRPTHKVVLKAREYYVTEDVEVFVEDFNDFTSKTPYHYKMVIEIVR